MARQWMTHDCFCNIGTHVAGQVGQKRSVLVEEEIVLGELSASILNSVNRKWRELLLFIGTLNIMRCTKLEPYNIKKHLPMSAGDRSRLSITISYVIDLMLDTSWAYDLISRFHASNSSLRGLFHPVS